MKKKLIVSIVVLLVSIFNINAQYRNKGSAAELYRKGDIEIGGNIGLNSSTARIQNENIEADTDSRISFNLAASGEYYFSDRWGLKTKLIYDNKGFDITSEDSVTGDISTVKEEYTYISVPVMASWHFAKKRNWYLNFGFYYAALVNVEVEDFEGDDPKDLFNSSDFGLAFGVGYKIPINYQTKLFIEYDGQTGFSDIDSESDSVTIRNARSALNIGVLFNL